MYEAQPDEKELAALGLTLDDVATDPIVVWPDNVQAYRLFNVIGTQWRVGMAGPVGLDYNVMYHKMDRMALTPDQYDDLESAIQAMERAALECMRKKDNV